MILLSIAVYVLCVLGIIISTIRMIKFGIHGPSDIIKYPFLIGVCVFCIVLITAVLIQSYYTVQNGQLITRFGFIKTIYAVKDIVALTFDREARKLVVQFQNEQYMTLTVNKEWTDALIHALLDANPDIDYAFTLTDTPPKKQDEDKK